MSQPSWYPPPPAPPQQAVGLSDGVMTVGYITSVLFPPVGVAIGIVALVKGRGGHGIAMMIVSLIVFTSVIARGLS